MIHFNKFEKLDEVNPSRILACHPDSSHLAMQTLTDSGRSAIWNKETGRIVWSPASAHALAWLQNGTQIALIQDPLQPEDYTFATYSWPSVHLIYSCPFSLPMGWPIDLVISPKNNLAICQWIDQTEFGFEFFDLSPQGVNHISQAHYMKEGTNDVTRPVFSTDGLIWVCCYLEREIWWASNPTDPDPDEPAHEGSYEIGALMVFNGKQQPPKYIPLIATISSGWLPPDPDDDDDAWSISDPVFIDAHHVTIHLPSGESQIHFVSAE